MAINYAVFSGNLTNDPKKFGTAENPGLGFSIAVNVRKRVGDEWQEVPFFINCTLFGKRAKALSDIMVKGMAVTVSGKMEPNTYTDKDGNPVTELRMIVDEVTLPPRAVLLRCEEKGW